MRRLNTLIVSLLIVALLALCIGYVPTVLQAQRKTAPANKTQPSNSAGDAFFDGAHIPEIRIKLKPSQLEHLQNDQRRFVECTLIQDGTTTYKKVAIKLKGAAGSFRDLSDRPAFTLKMKTQGERFHGMEKFHLNNSVQDESYLNELICSQLFQEAAYPATRVTHARVWLDDRDLGFYVLKEGFDFPFLERYFGDAKGNLYDGGFCVDINTPLEKDSGAGPDDHSDLQALAAACEEADEAKRWSQLEEKLDVEAFITFMALELMMCHWDGYSQNFNNYRLYFRTSDGRAVFLPHGMDQMFQDPAFAVYPEPPSLVARAVLSNPKWRVHYQKRIAELLPKFDRIKLHAKIDAARKRLRPVLVRLGEDRAQQFDEQLQALKERVADRATNIAQQRPPESWSLEEPE